MIGALNAVRPEAQRMIKGIGSDLAGSLVQPRCNELLVAWATDPAPSDLNLIKLAAFMGVPVRGTRMVGGQGVLEALRRPCCLSMSAETLRHSLKRPESL